MSSYFIIAGFLLSIMSPVIMLAIMAAFHAFVDRRQSNAVAPTIASPRRGALQPAV